jgi:hypothetical protein
VRPGSWARGKGGLLYSHFLAARVAWRWSKLRSSASTQWQYRSRTAALSNDDPWAALKQPPRVV